MAGLIQEQMGAAGAPVQDPAAMQDPAMQDPMAAQAGMEQMMPGEMMEEGDDEPLNEDDPVFQSALQFAMQALYESGAAKDVAQSLKSAPDPVMGMADTAYEITSVVGERVDGELPEELLPLLAMTVLQEVAEIGEAAGVDTSPTNVAEAFKQMLLRFLGEQGMDTTQLEQAMAEVDPAVFEQAANAEG
jgi:hypothetical protein